MMDAVETNVRLSGGISVEACKLAQADGVHIALKKPSGDQREPSHKFECSLAEWVEIVEAVDTLRAMLGKSNG